MTARDFLRMWTASVEAASGEMWSTLAGRGIHRHNTVTKATAQRGAAYGVATGTYIDRLLTDARAERQP